MPEMLKTPDFRNEREEAEWWDSAEGRAAILKEFQDARREGTVGRGTLKKAGLKYRTCLKSIIPQALRQEAGS